MTDNRKYMILFIFNKFPRPIHVERQSSGIVGYIWRLDTRYGGDA